MESIDKSFVCFFASLAASLVLVVAILGGVDVYNTAKKRELTQECWAEQKTSATNLYCGF